MTLTALTDALRASGIPFVEFAGDNHPAGRSWGRVTEDGQVGLFGDNSLAESGPAGTVDLFTRDLTGADLTAVERILRDLSQDELLTVGLRAVQYEQDTRLIHYHWVWESATEV